MEKKLSSYQKGKIIMGIINDLNEIEDKSSIYISEYADDMVKKIGKRTGIQITYSRESGIVDISESILITFDNILHRKENELNDYKPHRHSKYVFPEIEVSDELKQFTQKFEEKNIPGHGVCNTTFGEIFRAIQYIQYRAMNDGDECYMINSPSFMSFIYLQSKLDNINYSSEAHNEETGEYGFEFTDPHLVKMTFNGKIEAYIEDELARDADYTKYQLMDLLMNGKIKDEDNRFDSRHFTSINKENNNWY